MSLTLAKDAFLDGYRVGLDDTRDVPGLLQHVLALPREARPFAFEGGAMALRMRDHRDGGARSNRMLSMAEGVWEPLIRLGIGCALARLGDPVPEDPMTADGFGFQLGLGLGTSEVGTNLGSPYAARGRGRALWFVTDGHLSVCARLAAASPAAGPLWRGIGTACAFAGDPRHEAQNLIARGAGFEDEIRAGVRHGVELWKALEGTPPDRVLLVERAVREG